jgi:hypothetical protein
MGPVRCVSGSSAGAGCSTSRPRSAPSCAAGAACPSRSPPRSARWDDQPQLRELRAIEDSGAAIASMPAPVRLATAARRTGTRRGRGRAVRIPVLGNGDVRSWRTSTAAGTPVTCRKSADRWAILIFSPPRRRVPAVEMGRSTSTSPACSNITAREASSVSGTAPATWSASAGRRAAPACWRPKHQIAACGAGRGRVGRGPRLPPAGSRRLRQTRPHGAPVPAAAGQPDDLPHPAQRRLEHAHPHAQRPASPHHLISRSGTDGFYLYGDVPQRTSACS